MPVSIRVLSTGSLVLGLVSSLSAAMPLSQPASVLPWHAPQTQSVAITEVPVPQKRHTAPAWLLNTAKPLPKQAATHDALPMDLPMVEGERYTEIGQLRAGSTGARPLSSRSESTSTISSRSVLKRGWLDFFRSTLKPESVSQRRRR